MMNADATTEDLSTKNSNTTVQDECQHSKLEVSNQPSSRLLLASIVVSLGGGFLGGFQIIITNPAQEAFISFLNSSVLKIHRVQLEADSLKFYWGIIVASLFLGALIGALLVPFVAEKLGRKIGMLLAHSIHMIALIWTCASYAFTNYILFVMARFLLGGSITVSYGIATIFIMECSPVQCRFSNVYAPGFPGYLLQIGLLFGSVVAMPMCLGSVEWWYAMYGLEGLIVLVIAIATAIFPDSPVYLLSQNKIESARASMHYYQPTLTESEVEAALEPSENPGSTEKDMKLLEVFKDPMSCRGTLVGFLLTAGMAFSGSIAINTYSYDYLISIGMSSMTASFGTVAICAISLLGASLTFHQQERIPRRPLLITHFIFLGVMNTYLMLPLTLQETYRNSYFDSGFGYFTLVMWATSMMLLSAGPQCFYYSVSRELVSQKARTAVNTWINIFHYGLRCIVLVLFITARQWLGDKWTYVLMFGPSCFITAFLLIFYQQETLNRTPEEAYAAISELPILFDEKEEEEVDEKEVIDGKKIDHSRIGKASKSCSLDVLKCELCV